MHNAPSTPFIYSIKLSGIVLCNVNDMIISLLSELSQHIHIQNAETVFFLLLLGCREDKYKNLNVNGEIL